MKKIISTAALIFLGSALAFSVDLGGAISSLTKYTGHPDNAKFNQKTTFSAWLRTPLGNGSKGSLTYLAAEANCALENKFDDNLASDKKNVFTWDIALLKLNYDNKFGSDTINIGAGRFFISDLTGKIFAQNCDGAIISFATPGFSFSIYGGFTGLLNAQNAKILNGKGVSKSVDSAYAFADKYLILNAAVSFPYLFANQTLGFQFIGTFGFDNEKANRMYGTLSLNGPLNDILFYNLNSTVAFNNATGKDGYQTSNLSNLSLMLLVSKINTLFALNGTYASGQKEGGIKQFVGFTHMTATNAYSEKTEYNGITKVGLSASTKFNKILSMNLGTDVIFEQMVKKFGYFGFQYNAGLTIQPKSDLSFNAGFNHFIGDNSETNKLNGQLGIILTF